MRHLSSWGGAVLAVGAVALEAGSWSSPRASLVLAVAAVIGAGGWASLPLGALALAAVALPESSAGGSVEGWFGATLSAVGIGILARSVNPRIPNLFHGSRRVGTAVWLSLLAVLVTFLPDGHVTLFDSGGLPLTFTVVVEDAATGVRGIQELPAYLAAPHPGSRVLDLVRGLGPITAFLLLAHVGSREPRWLRAGHLASRLTGTCLVLSAVWGIGHLLAGVVTMPSAADLSEILSGLAGGRASVTVISVPEVGALTLASRPLTDWVRLGLGALLLVWPTWRFETPLGQGGLGRWFWLSLALACGVGACFVLGPSPCSWAIAAAVVVGAVALTHGRGQGMGGRWSDDLPVFALGIWLAAVIAPAAGWVTR